MKATVTAALIAAITITATGCASTTHAVRPAAHPLPTLSTNPAGTYTNPATPAAATPNPDGTYSGSCDYTLFDGASLYGNDHLIGEIDLRNTGNVGTITRVKITWPQEGSAPVTATRTVRLPYGKSKTVRFSVAVPNTGNVITLLQSWQERHGYRDGCHYHAANISTFGPAH